MNESVRSIIRDSNFQSDFSKLLNRRIQMLSALANQYLRLSHEIKECQIGSIGTDKPLIKDKFMHLDKVFAEKEAELFADYRARIAEHRKNCKGSKMIDHLDLAIAACKNKFNLAIFAVRKDATDLCRSIQDAGVQEVPFARLQSLKNLTLEKEVTSFYVIMGQA